MTKQPKTAKPLSKRPSRRANRSPLAAYLLNTEPMDRRHPLAGFRPEFLIDATGGNICVSDTELAELDAIEEKAQQSMDLGALAGLEVFRRDLELLRRAHGVNSGSDCCTPMSTALDQLLNFYWEHHGDAHRAQVSAAEAVLQARALAW